MYLWWVQRPANARHPPLPLDGFPAATAHTQARPSVKQKKKEDEGEDSTATNRIKGARREASSLKTENKEEYNSAEKSCTNNRRV